MTEETDDGSVDYPQQYKDLANNHVELIHKMHNHMHVLLTNALSAATETHVSMCLVNDANAVVQGHLSDALQSCLIAAEQARQAMNDLNAAR